MPSRATIFRWIFFVLDNLYGIYGCVLSSKLAAAEGHCGNLIDVCRDAVYPLNA